MRSLLVEFEGGSMHKVRRRLEDPGPTIPICRTEDGEPEIYNFARRIMDRDRCNEDIFFYELAEADE